MGISSYYNKGKLLKEGHQYTFRYIKCVTLEDNNQYMILEDQYGIRHFLEQEAYKAYNFTISAYINCLVAKINCTGRIYLEPEHPVYKIGNYYPFLVTSATPEGEGIQLIVKDCFNNMIHLYADSKILGKAGVDQTIIAKVESIKKGIPELAVIHPSEIISK